jgi:hypothetical protein
VRRVILILLALTVLVPSAALARTGFLCSIDGHLRRSCCCPSKAKQHNAAPISTIRSQCCCTVMTAAPVTQQPTTHELKSAPVPDVVAIVTPVPVIMTRVDRVTIAPRALAPPDPERSLFVRHCALLL